MRKPTSSTQLAAFLFVDSGAMSSAMLCIAALMVRLSNFYSSFKLNFSRIFCSSCSRIKPFDFRGSTVHIQGVTGGNVLDFGRMFLKLKYTDITKNTYIRS